MEYFTIANLIIIALSAFLFNRLNKITREIDACRANLKNMQSIIKEYK